MYERIPKMEIDSDATVTFAFPLNVTWLLEAEISVTVMGYSLPDASLLAR